ncbi:UNVERIFIED_CONTAM: DNA recombination protein RmuC, partial [Kocuria sp. CPCC 205295]
MEQTSSLGIVLPLVLFIAGAVVGLAVGWLLAARRTTDGAKARELESMRQDNVELQRRLAAAQESSRLQTERVAALEERSAQDQDVLTALAPLADRLRGVQEHVT